MSDPESSTSCHALDGRSASKMQSDDVSSDWRWILCFALVVMLLTSIPYLLGFAYEGSDWRFSGFVFGVEDGNSYIAKMLRGSAGEWLFRTPYTYQPQSGVIAFPFYYLIGKLAAPPELHEQLVVLFHIFRITAGLVSIAALYKFLAYYLPTKQQRRWGTVLGTLGGGLGWLLILIGSTEPFGSMPLEFYSPETFGFLELFGLPHLALARAGILICFLFILQILGNEEESLVKNALLAGFSWLVVGLAQPLSAVLIGLILFLSLILPRIFFSITRKKVDDSVKKSWRRGWFSFIIAGMVAGPFILYTLIQFSFDPFLSEWTTQNIISSPHPAHYLLAYGLILPFSVAGIKPLFDSRPTGAWIPVIWAFALPFLVYAPYNLQRRLAEGGWIALVCLAVAGVYRSRSWRRALIFATPFMLISSTLLVLGGIGAVRNPGYPLFTPVEASAAFQYVQQHAEMDDIFLASFETGNVLPAWAPVRVLVGHGPESVGLAEILPQVEAFYRADYGVEERRALLSRFRINYVFWGPEERKLGTWMPEYSDFLEPWYSSNGYQIYKVK